MSDRPLLSVIIAVYKAETTLERCLDSIFGQLAEMDGHGKVEVVAVNDASPDGSGAVLERYRESHSSLIIVTHRENRKEAGARNTGIEKSHGEYFTFLDADDEYAEGALGKILDAINNRHPDLIHYCYERVSPEGKFLSRTKFSMPGFHSTAPEGEAELKSVFQETAFGIMTSGGVYCRAVMPELRFSTEFPISPDRHFGWEFFRHCKNVFQINESLYIYYQYGDSVSRQLTHQAVSGLLQLDRLFWKEFQQHPMFDKAATFGFRRLFPGVVGWHFDIVFGQGAGEGHLSAEYFQTLNTYLANRGWREIGVVGSLWLFVAATIRSTAMVRTFRTSMFKLWLRLKWND